MPVTIVDRSQTTFVQILDESGKIDKKLDPKLSPVLLKKMYERMMVARVFDDTALKLQREGRIGTYPSLRGQEASEIGSALALGEKDWVFPSFREHGVLLARGLAVEKILLVWMGSEEGCNVPENVNILPPAIPVGSQLQHAVGAAYAAKLKKDRAVMVVYFGDGATSEGDFHEALNFAGVFQVPVVFVCQNNQWAISVSRKQQTRSKTLAQKAWAYGFEGVQVDGNDVLAVYSVVKEAIDKARQGKGPTLVECLTYRVGAHTTADDPGRYRDPAEVKFWEKRDPIERFRKYLEEKKLWSQSVDTQIVSESKEKIDRAVKSVELMKFQNVDGMFKFVYASMPENLQEQLNAAKGGKQ